MKIPNPKVQHGETVLVLNYRCNPPRWDEGECREVSYKNTFGSGWHWFYSVYISRGKGFFLYVGDEKIERKSNGK